MVNQTLNSKLMANFNEALTREEQRQQNKITNTPRRMTGGFIDKVVSKIRISDLAAEFGIDSCPECGYAVEFDDGNGFFRCVNWKYNHVGEMKHQCDFFGNIVDFVTRCGK